MDVRMGEPTWRFFAFNHFIFEVLRTESPNKYFLPEYIGFKEQTQGTETSKYLEERKSTDTPLVVASERGPAKPWVWAESTGKLS